MCTQTCMRSLLSFVRLFIRLFICSFVRSFVCLFLCLFVCLFVRLFVCLFVRSFFVVIASCWERLLWVNFLPSDSLIDLIQKKRVSFRFVSSFLGPRWLTSSNRQYFFPNQRRRLRIAIFCICLINQFHCF
jgi:hypothetical protein